MASLSSCATPGDILPHDRGGQRLSQLLANLKVFAKDACGVLEGLLGPGKGLCVYLYLTTFYKSKKAEKKC